MTAEPNTAAECHLHRRTRRLGLDERQLALVLLFAAPALFCSNMLTARATHDLFPPVALAFWRWTATLALGIYFTTRKRA